MGERSDVARAETERELDAIAGRLSGLFAALNEYPSIRWGAPGGGGGVGLDAASGGAGAHAGAQG
jgi:hypothetical protein